MHVNAHRSHATAAPVPWHFNYKDALAITSNYLPTAGSYLPGVPITARVTPGMLSVRMASASIILCTSCFAFATAIEVGPVISTYSLRHPSGILTLDPKY